VFWNALTGSPYTPQFQVTIASVNGYDLTGMQGATIKPDQAIALSDEFDLVVVPSEGMAIDPNSSSFKTRVDYLKHMHNKGTVIASICTGAFVVAATGILNEREATTHWALEKQFKRMFPAVKLNTRRIISDQGSVITSGGVSADHELALHLINRFCGQEIALQTTRCTLVTQKQNDQAPFQTFLIDKTHGDEHVIQCQNYIESHLYKSISNSELADLTHLSERTLHRRFKQATTESLVSYIQKLKIEKAKNALETELTSFDCIANSLGYENVSFFRRLFKKHTGLTPKDYRSSFYCLPYNP
jgi:transcriptional regulator GlxA family with amidase domain